MSGIESMLKTGSGDKNLQMQSTPNILYKDPETLLERAQALDNQALAQLHDRFYPVVFRYVSYRLENESLVEDICADVFLRLLDHLHKRKGEIHDLRAWLIGTASNLVNDHLRQKYRKPLDSLDDHELLPSPDNVQQTIEHIDSRRAIQQAMQQLTREQQHVLALRFSQGMSIEETAGLMNKTIGAVKVLQFRALAAVRKLLEAGEKSR